MSNKTPIPGIDYWPDAADWDNTPDLPAKPPSLVALGLRFLLVFVILQMLWLWVRDNSFGHFIRGDITVNPIVGLINILTPEVDAKAFGNQILAKGSSLVVKLGCEGIEVLFILIAALVTSPVLPSKAKLYGIVYGALFVYALNQLRILSLFYSFRADKSLFHLLHGTVTPLILVSLAGFFFQWWLLKYAKHR